MVDYEALFNTAVDIASKVSGDAIKHDFETRRLRRVMFQAVRMMRKGRIEDARLILEKELT